MPARVVLVTDDQRFADAVAAKLSDMVVRYADPARALLALEAAATVEVVVTRTFFRSQPIGISLAHMVRRARPGVRFIFMGDPTHRHYSWGLGEFFSEPVTATDIATIVGWLTGESRAA